MTGNTELIAVIRREIEDRGPVTFARFMGQALYHPQHGYYTSGRERIGKSGDFITSPTVGSLFGRFLGMQFAEMWESMGKPQRFVIIELGAHRGWLVQDVKQWAQERRQDFAEVIEYWTLDKAIGSRSTRSFRNSQEIGSGSIEGCIFSNELVDALPVHRIVRTGGAWNEIHVGMQHEALELFPGPLSFSPCGLPPLLTVLPYPDAYRTEIHLAARDWLREMARILKRGFVLTIDYGYGEEEYYAPHRTDGTLLCYHQHRTNDEPLERIGEQDITAHVNFDGLVRHGVEVGLSLRRFTDQAHFIMEVGQQEIERIIEAQPGQPDKLRQQLHTLLNPAGMGRTFKVLIQQKDLG